MDSYPRKTLNVGSAGHTYDYIYIKPKSATKSTLLFLHGFPAIIEIWSHQINYFADLGHTVIVPDLLGFGKTSKPHDPTEYCSWTVAEDVIGILNHEKVEKCHGIGHDAGVYVLSRLYNYYPDRWSSLTFMAVPYSPPGIHFDMDAMSRYMESALGFDKFGYIRFLAANGSHQIIEDHLESFLSIAYHRDVNVRAEHFYPPGKLESWLTANRIDNSLILTDDEKNRWIESFQKGDWLAATNGYRLMVDNLSEDREKADLAAGKVTTQIEVPVLSIASKADSTSFPATVHNFTGQYLQDKNQDTFLTVQSQGHYPHVLSAAEVNEAVRDLVNKVEV